MAINGAKFLKRLSYILKRTIHITRAMEAHPTIENYGGVEPVSMSFNVYEKRRNENYTPLIVMHGLFGSKNNWNSLSKAINEITFRKIITVDARNHGDSPHSNEFSYYHLVADIHYLMRSLNIPKANLMGHSMGGRAAMLYSLLYPDYLEKLIIVDISPTSHSTHMIGMTKYFEAMRSVNLKGVETLSEARKKANEQLSIWVSEMEVRQFLLTNIVKEAGKYHWRINLDVLEKSFHDRIMGFPSVGKYFEKPVLFIGGSKSDYIRREDHYEILKIFPKAIFEYLDTGHWVHAEKPKEFLQLIATFLKD